MAAWIVALLVGPVASAQGPVGNVASPGWTMTTVSCTGENTVQVDSGGGVKGWSIGNPAIFWVGDINWHWSEAVRYTYNFECKAAWSTTVTCWAGVLRQCGIYEASGAGRGPLGVESRGGASTGYTDNGKSCEYDGIFVTDCTMSYVVEPRSAGGGGATNSPKYPERVEVCPSGSGLLAYNKSQIPDTGLTTDTATISPLNGCKAVDVIWTFHQAVADAVESLYACAVEQANSAAAPTEPTPAASCL